MKPNFALHLTHEGITLLHRAKAGWLRIGDVALDAPDLEDQLKVLRRTASDLESGGLTTKLVIPESQVLYTTINIRGRDTAAQISQIRDGLVGLTPYEVKDLVFDWRIQGTRAHVAVVARDTLQEAEAFAAEFRFNPVSYVAIPETGHFDGEPFFGPTKHAATLLEGDDRVEPDKTAMVVMSTPRPKPQIRLGAKKTAPEVAIATTDLPTKTETVVEPAQPDAPPDVQSSEALQSEIAKPEPDRSEVEQPATDMADPGQDPSPAKDTTAETVNVLQTAPDTPDPVPAEDPLPTEDPVPEKEVSLYQAPVETLASASVPQAADPVPEDPAPIAEPEIQSPADPEPELVPVAFSSRRRGAASVPEPSPKPRADLPPLETQTDQPELAPLDPIPAPPKTRPSITLPPKLAEPARAPETVAQEVAKPVETAKLSPAAQAAAIGTINTLDPLDDIPEMPPSFGALGGVAPERGITPMPMTSAKVAGGAPISSTSVSDRADAAARSLAKTVSGSLADAGENTSGLRKVAGKTAIAAGGAVAGTVAGALTGTVGLLGRGTAAGVKRLRARPTAVAASNTEAQAMTVFGERNQTQVGGKPRFLGLMLTLSLLLALAVLALWSTFFLSDNNPGVFDNADETPQIAALEPSPSDIEEPGADRSLDLAGTTDTAEPEGPNSDEIGTAVDSVLSGLLGTDEPASGTQDPAVEPPVDPETAPIDTADTAALPQQEPAFNPAPDQVQLPPPSRVEAEASYAATGIWQLDPEPLDALPLGDRLEDVFVASLDASIAADTLSDLPATEPLLNDRRPEALRPPAPLGTRFDFDERGFIRATPDGALTPDGARVFSGTPSFVPPARPGTEPPLRAPEPPVTQAPVAPAPEPETPVEPDPVVVETPTTPVTPEAETPVTEAPSAEEPAAETVQEQSLTPEQLRLREIRPRLRPETLEETTNRAVPLGSTFEGELAAVRPDLRPASLQVTLPEPDVQPEPEVAVVPEPEVEPDQDNGTELAVAASRLPTIRPRGLAARAARAAEQAPVAPVAPPAPNVAAAVVPAVPARASVAKAATERNAINLSRVNLIGVYGSPSDRRALVRLKNGRYVKVEVGDRVDGGRVSAISAKELLYVKGGRNITLQMPQG